MDARPLNDQGRILFVGGPYDGTWRTVPLQATMVELPPGIGVASDLPLGLSASVVYLRTELGLGDNQSPLVFYRLSTMTARQAITRVLSGYGRNDQV
jgi:hypothetical protein